MDTLTKDRADQVVDDPAPPRPRRRWFRRAVAAPRGPLIVVHRWLGLVLLLWVLVESFTGAALVFAPEIDRWANGDAYATTSGDVGMDRAVEAARDARPSEPVSFIEAPGGSGPTYIVYTIDRDGELHTVLVDPGSGKVTARDHHSPGWLRLMERLHFNLNSTSVFGLKATAVLGWLAIGWLVVLFSGFYVWYWPRVKRWARLFKLRRRSGRYAFQLDLHNMLGVVVLLPLTLVVLTGINFVFPDETRDVYEVVTFGAYDDPDTDVAISTPDGTDPMTAGDAARIVERLDPAVDVQTVITPGGSSVGIYNVHAHVDGSFLGMLGGEHEVEFAVDQYSGRVLRVSDRLDEDAATQAYDDWAYPVHVGTFGGDVTRWLWVALGLVPFALAWTGVVMWLVRRRPKPESKEKETTG